MKALVIIFVPMPRPTASTVRELISHFLADVRGIRDARLRHDARTIARGALCADQLWTWFLPNPLWSPKERNQS